MLVSLAYFCGDPTGNVRVLILEKAITHPEPHHVAHRQHDNRYNARCEGRQQNVDQIYFNNFLVPSNNKESPHINPTTMPPIRVGVIGYGFAAKSFHLPFINAIPDYEVVAILQRAEKPAEPESVGKGVHCTVDFPHVTHHRTAEDFFANSEIEFVVVASHADTHASFAEQALKAGKHGKLCNRAKDDSIS
jgi:hypothetical protein